MLVRINNKKVKLQQTNMSGAEGEIFLLKLNGEDKCVKIYDPTKRTPYQEKKVLSLIQKFKQFNFGGVEEYLAFPELPVYDVKKNKFCGFVMKYFKGYQQISKYSYDLATSSFMNSKKSNEYFLKIIDELYTYIHVLHTAGIILGDLNPQNILIAENSKPVFVDVDSAQVGTFYSNSQRKEYMDAKVQMDGFGNNKFFVYSTDSDIFSLSIIFYELMIGSNPYFYQTNPPTESYYKKERNISFLDSLKDISKIKSEHNLLVIKNNFYYKTWNRIIGLSNTFPKVIEYFTIIFEHNHRTYFSIKPNKQIPKIMSKKYKNLEGINYIMGFSKEDPKELSHFMNQFNISI